MPTIVSSTLAREPEELHMMSYPRHTLLVVGQMVSEVRRGVSVVPCCPLCRLFGLLVLALGVISSAQAVRGQSPSPASPITAIRQLEADGQVGSAIEACKVALAGPASDYVLSEALYHKARLCLAAERLPEARAAAIDFMARFPELSRAAAMYTLLAHMEEGAPIDDDRLIRAENAASEVYEAGRQAYKAGDLAESLRLMSEVLSRFSGTPASLRALDHMGHVFLKQDCYHEATEPFLRVLEMVGDSAPTSRVVRRARVRLGAIYRRLHYPEHARAMFMAVEGDSGAPALAAEAALQLIGMAYESLRVDSWHKRTIDPQRWVELEARCRRLAASQSAPAIYRCKAELILLETYAWRKQREDVYVAANALFEKYKGKAEFNREIATASTFVAESLLSQNRYAEAIPHWEFVLTLCPRGVDYWPGEQVLDRAIYQLQYAKSQAGAPPSEIRALATELAERFPSSGFTRTANRRTDKVERQHAERMAK
ncbi:MAG: hypothetical protein GXY55_00800 [Phycisphaerae bacterium]|nr:hypothetical protein [Phycisphaerae bacterium]